ncbi:hypothetical protein PP175_29115 (plasmid) [Aneurinibacillus sp. Ricciae_BoGa-3]|uniref:hypothetical protein n=1 Tax=Aneurinibacillus sp. Ricciae_BoGa-3 TaxID=3022697 RepID=UPI00234024F4|nr:hypothetical protein [Aneurinibacillus sp. Ricciae_BoGa-3]WCK57253.1 hypothetical protein PP175_29115 [Aneurinibacillus sp. Ricciae_BoGa-3]
MNKRVQCERCQYCSVDWLSENLAYQCKKGQRDLSRMETIEGFEVECTEFKSRYIEYPLEITGIDKSK